MGYSGTGTFTQSGATNNSLGYGGVLYLGYNAGSNGSYSLSGSGRPSISSSTECIGYSGTGSFTQSGGMTYNSLDGLLYLGCKAGSSGSYSLSGSGWLSSGTECVGCSGSGAFTQLAGENLVGCLSIGSQGRYQFSGGLLQINGCGLANQGTFDATESTGTLTVTGNAIVDLSQATLVNTGSMSLSIGPNSLLLLPAGFNPATAFGIFQNQGLAHNVGTPLTILPGQGFSGIGAIADLVNCQGTISPTTSGSINLNGGVMVSGTGNVNLGGNGQFTVNNSLSGITGGWLTAGTGCVGYSGLGTFTQTGGTNSESYPVPRTQRRQQRNI